MCVKDSNPQREVPEATVLAVFVQMEVRVKQLPERNQTAGNAAFTMLAHKTMPRCSFYAEFYHGSVVLPSEAIKH